MIPDDELVDAVRRGIRRSRAFRVYALGEQARLRKGLSRGASEAEDYRECAISDADWRMVEPVATLLFDRQWVSRKDYDLVRDVMLDYADEFARLLAPDRIRGAVPDDRMPAEDGEE